MGQFGNVFSTIHNSKPVNSFAPKLPEGTHTVVLKRFEPKDSDQNMGTILEGDFIIGQSQAARAGETRGWPWFIGQSGWAGAYEGGRAKQFIESIMLSLKDHIEKEMPYGQLPTGEIVPLNPYTGQVFLDMQGRVKNAHDDETIGEITAMGYFKGVQLGVEVRKNFKKDGSLRTDKKGNQTYNAIWAPIPQTYEQVKAMAAALEAQAASAPAPAAPAPAVQPVAAQPLAAAPVQTLATQPVAQAAPVQSAPVAAQPLSTQPVGAVQVQPISGGVLAGLRKQ